MSTFAKTTVLHQLLCGILGGVMTGCGSTDKLSCDNSANINALQPAPDWSGIACDINGKMDLLTGLNPTYFVDGLALYGVDSQGRSSITEAGGPPCVNAINLNQCTQSIYSLNQSLSSNALIVTNADAVNVLQSQLDVKSFLGQLSHSQKVFTWMHSNGISLSCVHDDSAVLADPDGQNWSAVYTEFSQNGSDSVRERVRLNISVTDWSIVEMDRAVVSTSNFGGLCYGRLPHGRLSLALGEIQSEAVGDMLARHAAYEAASVIAFIQLHRELNALGAPLSLLSRIEKAADDERRHAIQVGALAERYGKTMESFSFEASPERDMEAIAINNMQEGCVGESWGALIGLYQAQHACDPVIAETMTQVAMDEVEHASLSWEINDWLSEQLSADALERVKLARQVSLDRVVKRTNKPVDRESQLLAGLPEPEVAELLAKHLVNALAA